MTYTFTIPIEPRGQMRVKTAAFAGHARAYKATAQSNYEAKVRAILSGQLPERPIDGPIWVTVEVTLAIPASWSKRKRDEAFMGQIHPTSKPDISNCLKNIEDIMNGLVWTDDKNIVDARCVKRYGLLPGWRVTVRTEE